MAGKIITVAQQKGGSGKTTVAVNLALALRRQGARIALLDTDPQGSLGRWFLTRLDAKGEDDHFGFGTASAWGVSYETAKLARDADYVIVDTPPKADSDLRPALRAADLALIPIAVSHVDLWATESVLDLAQREKTPALIVLNRIRAGTKLAAQIEDEAAKLDVPIAQARLGFRQVYAESIGQGTGAMEHGNRAAADEITALAEEIKKSLSS